MGRPALDQPLGRWSLHQAARAGPAGELQPPRHDHPELGGHDIEALAFIGTDLVHGLAAAGADRAFGCDGFDNALRPALSTLVAASASAAPAQGGKYVVKRPGIGAAAHAHGGVRDFHCDGSFSPHRCRSRRYWRGIIRQERDKRRGGLASGGCGQRQHACPRQPPPIVYLLRTASMPLRELRDHYVRRQTQPQCAPSSRPASAAAPGCRCKPRSGAEKMGLGRHFCRQNGALSASWDGS